MLRAIVFDFDGVIANSEPLHFQAFHDVLAEEGVPFSESEYYARYLGFDDLGVLTAVAGDRDRHWTSGEMAALLRRKARRLDEIEHGQSVLFPGAAAAIVRLAASCPLAIASGAQRNEIVRVLDRERLAGYFPVIVAAEDVPASKPAPDPYLRAVADLAAATRQPIAPAECVAVEDSHWGLASARAAGLRTVGVTHTYAAEALAEADLVVASLDLLTWALLSRLDGGAMAQAGGSTE
jgi:HAD superfamily hydrolase (TIGR01509 family)